MATLERQRNAPYQFTYPKCFQAFLEFHGFSNSMSKLLESSTDEWLKISHIEEWNTADGAQDCSE